MCGRKALAQAGITLDDIDFFDLYSCFPSAVEIACDALGIAEDDPRPLTVTGGLSFFGGPGNAYVLHSIAETSEWLRRGKGRFGMVTGNGGLLSKQSVGIYSTEPGAGEWRRENPADYQPELDAALAPRIELTPQGKARIESYTVMCDKGVPARGVIVGRLLADDARFVANTPKDRPEILQWLMAEEPLNAEGLVTSENGRNTFVPARFG
jgi:acetyl-CoA C-acetyltransferase